MDEPVALIHDGHRCRLKWHRGRRHATDTAFSPERIRQGLSAGAAVEIDLNPLACGGWAVLHDETLDRETTGTGPVAGITAKALSALRLRDNSGQPTALPVATLEGLAESLATAELRPGGHLQLDLKVGMEALTEANVTGFVRSVTPVAGHMILSGGDAAAVLRLAERSGVGLGFDPCHEAEMVDLVRSRDFDGFVMRAITAMPEARIVYLYRGLVSFADRCGADLIGPFRARGQEVDVYTIPDASPENLSDARRFLDLRADQITTDDPSALALAMVG